MTVQRQTPAVRPASAVTQADDLVEVAPGLRTLLRDEGQGRIVVLLHGTPFDVRAWDPLVGALDGRCRTVRFDARGHGTATAVPVADYRQLATDVVAVLDRLDIDDAHVVGHSWGGQIAQQVALDHPQRVNRLSLLCTRASPFPAFASVATSLRDGTADKEASVARWFSRDELAEPDSVAVAVRAWLRGADPHRWAEALELISTFDVLDRLHRVGAPTDVVAAEFDGVAVPGHMAQIADTLPDASLRVVTGTRHLLPLQYPDEIARIVEDRR
jgi:3-oxoadipate enol-lactonase